MPHPSTASSGTASSGASVYGDTPNGRGRVESSASNTSQWPIHESQSSPQLATVPGSLKRQGSPSLTSPAILPGYRESIFGGSQHSLPWREGQRDEHTPRAPQQQQQLPRISSVSDRRLSQPISDPLNLTGSPQHAHRTTHPPPAHPPPLLTSESTNRSTTSSSTSSSTYLAPRTPMEPAIDRPLPIPLMYPQKQYDTQLPPLRPPSLSPQTSIHTQQSPNGSWISSYSPPSALLMLTFVGIHPILDFPTSIAPIRGYTATTGVPQHTVESNDDRLRDYGSYDDNNLDPVSALLRAGEIVNRNSRGRP